MSEWTKQVARERAERGAARLNEHEVHWRGLINLSRLDMSSTSECVLGQVFDDYNEGLEALQLPFDGEAYDDVSFGFDTDGHVQGDPNEPTYMELHEAWEAIILDTPEA